VTRRAASENQMLRSSSAHLHLGSMPYATGQGIDARGQGSVTPRALCRSVCTFSALGCG
jgi:hypothetical protein